MNQKKKSKTAQESEPANGQYLCPECQAEFPSLASLSSHLRTHIPPKTEKYHETIVRILKEHKGQLEKSQLMELCQEANPSASRWGVKAYASYIAGLARRKKNPPIKIETIVFLIE